MNQDLLNQLLKALPLHSEEDDLREEIPEAALQKVLPGEAGTATLRIVRRLFESCGLLDARLLNRGVWAFVSFPAALAGHSLLQTLATPGQSLFEPDYWRQGTSDVEEQRKMLNQIETRRVRLHPENAAPPIRYVYVAWGFIRLGGHFLLHHREDKSRPDTRNYVLPGGRVKPGDLPVESQTAEGLRQMHASHSGLMMAAFPKTLARELREETGLLAGEDYQASERVVLAPYRRVEGAGNKHAYTEYLIALYDIALTPEGEVKLLETVSADSDKLVWFSVGDLSSPIGRADGKSAFIDAMKVQYGKTLEDFLNSIPSSSNLPFRFSERSEAVELPIASGQPIRIGETGKEKPLQLELPDAETAFLAMAAMHTKGIDVQANNRHVWLFPGGWVKAESIFARETMTHLAATLGKHALPLVEIVRDDFCRVTVEPDVLFFNDAAFRYRLTPNSGQRGILELTFRAPASDFNSEVRQELEISLPSKMVNSLRNIAAGGVRAGGLETCLYSDETLKKNFKEMLDDRSRPLGLRKLVRQAANLYQISVLPLEE